MAITDTDATHAVHIGATYAQPVGHGRALLGSSNGAVDAVLDGWSTPRSLLRATTSDRYKPL